MLPCQEPVFPPTKHMIEYNLHDIKLRWRQLTLNLGTSMSVAVHLSEGNVKLLEEDCRLQMI